MLARKSTHLPHSSLSKNIFFFFKRKSYFFFLGGGGRTSQTLDQNRKPKLHLQIQKDSIRHAHWDQSFPLLTANLSETVRMTKTTDLQAGRHTDRMADQHAGLTLFLNVSSTLCFSMDCNEELHKSRSASASSPTLLVDMDLVFSLLRDPDHQRLIRTDPTDMSETLTLFFNTSSASRIHFSKIST